MRLRRRTPRGHVIVVVIGVGLVLAGCESPVEPTDIPEITEKLRIVVDTPSSMFVEHPPAVVVGGSEEFVYSDLITIPIGGRTVKEIFSFHGLDRGDRAEMDTNIYLDNVPIFLRSMHKEDFANFDAWESKLIEKSGQSLRIELLCRVTGPNSVHARLIARPHWGIWFSFGDDTGRLE